jgi:hypothetical protein
VCEDVHPVGRGDQHRRRKRSLETLGKAPLADEIDAVSGGTDKYTGVRGEVRIETRGSKVISTFHFIGYARRS